MHTPSSPLVDAFVIDDDIDFRTMICSFLQTKDISYRDFADPVQAVQAYVPAQVGCVLVDVKMAKMDGLQVTKKLKSLDPMVPIIVVTGYGDITHAIKAIKFGAMDYLQKPLDLNILYTKIMECLTVTQAVRGQRLKDSKMRINLESLTFRERQILSLVAMGLSNKEIGLSLDISYRTVEVHRSHIMEKLEADSVVDLVRIMHYSY